MNRLYFQSLQPILLENFGSGKETVNFQLAEGSIQRDGAKKDSTARPSASGSRVGVLDHYNNHRVASFPSTLIFGLLIKRLLMKEDNRSSRWNLVA